MTILDSHSAIATILPAGLKLRPTDAQLTLDESWSPFAQLRLEAELTPAELDAIDPRDLQELQLSVSRHLGSPWTLATLTAAFGGSLAALTSAFGDRPLSAFNITYSRPYNKTRMPSTTMRSRLTVTRRSYDHRAGRLTLEAASGEVRLQSLTLLATEPYDPSTTSVRAIAELLLARLGATLQPGIVDGVVDAAATIWKPGTSAWDYIAPLAQKSGLKLWCDHQGRWLLTEAQPPAPGTVVLSTTAHPLTELVDEISVDDDEWFDGVVVEYRWVDDLDLNRIEYDTAGPDTALNVHHVRHDTAYPGPGAAAGILTRARGRGRRLDITGVATYSVLPGQAARISPPDTELQTGYVASVTYELAIATMRVRSRGLVDTPPFSYLAAPESLRYLDVPIGMSYLDYDPELIGA